MTLMTNLFLFTMLALASLKLSANPDCPANYPNGRTLTYSSGAMDYPDGRTLRYSSGAMDYPNGRTLRYSSGALDYMSGRTLRYSSGAMDYPNGRTLRYSSGAMDNPDGSTNTTGSIVLTADFNSEPMRIVVRPHSAEFQFSLPFGNGILLVKFDELGNVQCTVEGQGPTDFKVIGAKGSAYVSVNPGADASAIRAAIQKALD